jgi:hypothetical protein
MSYVVSNTPTVTAGGYSANDVVGGEMAINGIPSSDCILQSVTIIDQSGQDAAIEVLIFEENITTPADNSAWSFTSGDEPKLLARVEVGASDYKAVGGGAASIAEIRNLAIPISTQAKTNNAPTLYAVMVTTGTPTYVATDDITLKLGFLPY